MKDLMNKITHNMICVGLGLVVTSGLVMVILSASNFKGW